MKGPAGNASKLKSLIDKHAPAEAPPHPRWSDEFADDPVNVFVHSILAWEAPLAQADAAFAKLSSRLFDWNDLRVCLVDETMEIVGPRYPNAFARLRILRNTLTTVYKRHHKVDLAHLESAGKREARSYLEGLPELPTFVAHRVLTLRFRHTLVPIDARILAKLQDAGVIHADASEADAASWITKEVASDRAVAACHALHAFADATPDKPARSAAKARGGAGAAKGGPGREKKTAPKALTRDAGGTGAASSSAKKAGGSGKVAAKAAKKATTTKAAKATKTAKTKKTAAASAKPAKKAKAAKPARAAAAARSPKKKK